MLEETLRRRGQSRAASIWRAAALTVMITSGCADEADLPDGIGTPGNEAGLSDSGGGAIASDAGGGPPPVPLDASAPAVDATTPRDAASPFDANPSPRDAGRDTGSTMTGSDAAPSGPNPEPGRLAGITAAHNAVRARVSTGTPLPPLTWSPEIATVAQAYAEKLAASCSTTLTHSSSQERMGWGENLAMMGGVGSGPAGSAQQAVDLWESELMCYTFGPFQSGVNATCTNACSRYGGCGHYTQVVWRKTLRLGCGVGECMSGSSKRAYWVCNYDPPGNYVGQMPY